LSPASLSLQAMRRPVSTIRHFVTSFVSNLASEAAFSLVELLVVLAVMSVCLLVALVTLPAGLSLHTARGAAQSWQAAAAWAQLEVMWRGGFSQVECDANTLTVAHNTAPAADAISGLAPASEVLTNAAAWRSGDVVVVRFSGVQASPNGGGSLYFGAQHGAYRIAVRPESGLTTRSWAEGLP